MCDRINYEVIKFAFSPRRSNIHQNCLRNRLTFSRATVQRARCTEIARKENSHRIIILSHPYTRYNPDNARTAAAILQTFIRARARLTFKYQPRCWGTR